MAHFLVSIIIPVYKVEPYIERCLQSVLSQTYSHEQIECLLVDDCSPDRSMAIARQVIEQGNRDITFVYLRHEENQGLSEARNTGIRHARGEFLIFLDSDDYFTPECIELHMREVDSHPDVEVVLGNFFHDKPGGGLRVKESLIPKWQEGSDKIYSAYLRDILPMTAWNVLIRRDLVTTHHLQFCKRLLQEDILWSFHLYRNTSKMAFFPQVSYMYCDNAGSLMNDSDNSVRFASSYCTILHDVNDHLDDRCYVDSMLFALRQLFRGIGYAQHPSVPEEYLEKLNAIRDTMFVRNLKNGRLVLAGAFLSLYKPFSVIQKSHLFRRYFDHWLNSVGFCAKLVRLSFR